MEAIIGIIAWPCATIIILAIFMLVFKDKIGSLLQIIKIKKAGYEACIGKEDQILPEKKQNSDFDPLVKMYNSQTINLFVEDLKSEQQFQVDDKEKLIEILFRCLALSRVAAKSEEVYSLIFGSQLNLLLKANSVEILSDDYAREWYSFTVSNNPALSDFPYERFMQFFLHYRLLIRKDHGYQITYYGREFITYMTLTGKNFSKMF